jgi:hypothetical protein
VSFAWPKRHGICEHFNAWVVIEIGGLFPFSLNLTRLYCLKNNKIESHSHISGGLIGKQKSNLNLLKTRQIYDGDKFSTK